MCTLVATGMILRSLECNTHTPSVWRFLSSWAWPLQWLLAATCKEPRWQSSFNQLHMELTDREESTFQEVFLLTYKGHWMGPSRVHWRLLLQSRHVMSNARPRKEQSMRRLWTPFAMCTWLTYYIRTLKSPKRVITWRRTSGKQAFITLHNFTDCESNLSWPNSVAYLNRTLTFEWWMVRCEFENGH